MVFITPVYKKFDCVTMRWLLATLLWWGQSAWADFKIVDIDPRLSNDSLEVSGKLELAISPKVEEALSKGIPIDVIIDLGLYRKRNWVWDQTYGRWALTRRISYHALSGQYLITLDAAKPEEIDSHTSLQEALNLMGTLTDVKFSLPTKITPEGHYILNVRASLDIESLPAPLRPVAYTSFAWHLTSGWTTWKIQP